MKQKILEILDSIHEDRDLLIGLNMIIGFALMGLFIIPSIIISIVIQLILTLIALLVEIKKYKIWFRKLKKEIIKLLKMPYSLAWYKLKR